MLVEQEGQTCVACGESLGDYNLASCQYCGGRFHQPWESKIGSPCGQVISHGEALVIVFICNNCYNESDE